MHGTSKWSSSFVQGCNTINRPSDHVSFLTDLKNACLEGKPGNQEFWERVTDLGRDISLVSKSEAARLGGKSNITEAQATEVSEVWSLVPKHY